MGNKPQIILYGLATSTCIQRVIATLAEKQLNFKLTSIDVAGGEHKLVVEAIILIESILLILKHTRITFTTN
ncbi:unnamed protein product [Rotaria magnacalcarata]